MNEAPNLVLKIRASPAQLEYSDVRSSVSITESFSQFHPLTLYSRGQRLSYFLHFGSTTPAPTDYGFF